jgi:hypothetical protein
MARLISAFCTRCIINKKRQFSTKIHFMYICPCLKHTIDFIFSLLAVKRSDKGVYMKSSIGAFECASAYFKAAIGINASGRSGGLSGCGLR